MQKTIQIEKTNSKIDFSSKFGAVMPCYALLEQLSKEHKAFKFCSACETWRSCDFGKRLVKPQLEAALNIEVSKDINALNENPHLPQPKFQDIIWVNYEQPVANGKGGFIPVLGKRKIGYYEGGNTTTNTRVNRFAKRVKREVT